MTMSSLFVKKALSITAGISTILSGVFLVPFALDNTPAAAASDPVPFLHYDASDQNSFNPQTSPTAVKNLGSLGSQLDATIVTAAGANEITLSNQAFSFDGSSSHIRVPTLPPSINFSGGPSEEDGITVDFVADFKAANNHERIFHFSSGPNELFVTRADTGTDLVLKIGSMYASFGGAIETGPTRYTISASRESVLLYKSCNATATSAATSGAASIQVPPNADRSPNYIGTYGAAGQFEGELRYLRIYNQPLTAQQVLDAGCATVTFDANGGTGTMADQTGATAASLTANTFERTDYVFTGWSRNPDGSTLDFADEASFDFSTESSTTLYARWAPDGMIVTFNANGGSGSMEPQIAKISTALRSNSFTNGNKIFREWTIEQDGTGDAYADEASFPFTTSGSQVLYAQWDDAPNRTVQFDANGGTGTMADQTTNEPTPLSANLFERDNFAFEKWSTNPDGSGTSFNNEEVYQFNEDLVLYAQWVETAAFSVTFNGNGASGGNMTAQTSSVPTELKPNQFSRWARTFLGWSTSKSGQVEYADRDIFEFEADAVLYAVWGTAVTVSFDKNASDATGTMESQLLAADTILSSNSFSRPGFVFSHWATSASGGGAKYPDGWAGPVLARDVTLYAQWVQDSGAMVSFNANGGNLGTLMGPQEMSTARALLANQFAAPKHKAFRGWSTEPDGTGDIYSNKEVASFTQDTVLFAQWGINIQLRPNGGSPNSNQNVVIDSPSVIPDSPFTRNNQVFVGWTNTGYLDQRSGWFSPGEPISITRQLVLHARWAPTPETGEHYAVFAPNGGVLKTGSNYLQVQAGSAPTPLMANPYERAGHSFRGWAVQRGGPAVYTDQETFDFDQTQVFQAVWWQNRVRFEPNGATGSVIGQSGKSDAPLTFNTFSRPGYIFAGWNTAQDGTGKPFADGQLYPFGSPEQTKTLYAQWLEVQVGSEAVRFNGNGSTSGYMAPQQSASAANLSSNKFTRSGYQFAGWSTNRNGGATTFADGGNYDFSQSMVLYAQWDPLVTYRPNGAAGAAMFQEINSSNHTLEPNSFTRAGHKFVGWATDPEKDAIYADTQTLALGNINNQGALTLHAKWAEVSAGESIVVYQSNYNSPDVIFQTSASAAPLTKSFGRNGHTLLGWATSPAGSVEYELSETYDFQSDLVLYAVWEQNTIVFDANGGKGTMANQVRTWNAPLPSSEFTRSGFVFSTWNTEADGSGRSYSAGLTYPSGSKNMSTTLYAQWVVVPGSQVISFSANGGFGSMRTQVTPSNSDLTLAPAGFARDGHIFLSWNTEADGSGDEYQDGETIRVASASFTLFAQWLDDGSITNQTVSFDPNGGTGTMPDQTVLGRQVLNSNTFEKANSVFTGWNTLEDGSGVGYADNSQILALGPVTLYAQWITIPANAVAISFDPNGGSGSAIQPLVGTPATPMTIPQNTFSKAGFKFLGWNSDQSATSAAVAGGAIYSLPSQSETLYAIWEAEFFTVTFDANDGSGVMPPQTSDEETNLLANKFTRDRFEFLGWNTNQNAFVPTYLDAASYAFTESDTLYAIWRQVDFTVTFDGNGATSGSMPDQTASGLQPLAANLFTKANARFLGWATSSAGAVVYANTANFDFIEDEELFAKWENLSVVTFDNNGGTGDMSPQAGSSPAPLRLNEFERDGYTFQGWKTNPLAAAADFADGESYDFASTATLYAHWELATYTVTFNANGGSGSMPSQVASGIQNLSPMSGIDRIGFSFLGWNTNPNANSALYSDTGTFEFTQDVILYAIWSKTQNSVTWDSNGGSAITGTNFVVGDTIAKPADPARAGRFFGGWSTSETNDQGNISDLVSTWPYEPPTPANITFHAIWYAECSDVEETFELGGTTYTSISILGGDTCIVNLPEDVQTVDVLVVGGGGGGGANIGAGGGGGGVTVRSSVTVDPSAQIFATVGSGGIAGVDGNGTLDGGAGGRSEISMGALNLFANGGAGGNTYWSNVSTCIEGDPNQTNQALGGSADPNGDPGVGGTGARGGNGGRAGNINSTNPAGEFGGQGYSLDFLGTAKVFGSGGGGSGFGNVGGLGGSGAGKGGTWPSRPIGTDGVPNQGGGGGGGEQGCNAGGAGGSGIVALRFEAPTFVVSFDAGSDGTGSLADLEKTYLRGLTLPDSSSANAALVRDGFMVGGWATADGGPKVYELGATYNSDEPLTLYPVWVPLSVLASGDAHVQSGDAAQTNFGSSETLVLKNAADSITSNSNRVAFLEFTYNPNTSWSNAALEVYVATNADGLVNNGYNSSYTTFNVDVYGATDASWDEGTISFLSANSSQQGWGIQAGTWPWTPKLATYLGTISIPTSSLTEGQKFSISTAELDQFLNDDADGNVTLFLARSDTDGEAELSLASKENPVLAGPTLVLASQNYTFTVAYDLNGGTGSLPQSGSYTAGGSSYTVGSTAAITAPRNKTLVGWNTKADGTGVDFLEGDSYDTPRTVTLYAKYLENPRVTFTSNFPGGASDVNQSVPRDIDTALRANNFVRPGYNFVGWNTAIDGTGTAYDDEDSLSINSDLTLHAQWVGASYLVVFDYNGADGGNTLGQGTYTTGEAELSLPTPTRTGFTFDGWYESADFSGVAVDQSFVTARDRTLYAKWTAEEYSLSYLNTGATGGTAPTDQATYNIGDQAVIKANTSMVKAGYDFVGWVLDPQDSSETPKNAGDRVQFADLNISLSPKWAPRTQTITFSLNGATAGTLPSPDTYTSGDNGVSLPDGNGILRTGYTFAGWSTTPGGALAAEPYAPTENVTLYASWTINSIGYSFAAGAINSVQPSVTLTSPGQGDFGSEITLPALSASDQNQDSNNDSTVDHVFAGWSDGNDVYAAGDRYRLGESDVTFTATWAKVLQVRYTLNGGSPGGTDTELDSQCTGPDNTCVSGDVVRSNIAPNRTGYNFLGWKDQSGTEIAADTDFTVSDSSYLLYAQWDAIDYQLVIDFDGGENANTSVTRNIGETYLLPASGNRVGHTFTGWSDGTTTYPVGAIYEVGSAGVTFTAQWSVDTYTITFDWQGGNLRSGQTNTVSDTYTYGSGDMSLPSGDAFEKDGFVFAGWSTTPGGTEVDGYQPTADGVLYALWADGDYLITFDPKGGTMDNQSATVPRTTSLVLPEVVRPGFVLTGWYDAPSSGVKLGDEGDAVAIGASRTLYANWVQKSLFGIDMAELESVSEISVGSTTGGTVARIHGQTGISAMVEVPAGALPDNSVVSVRFFKDPQSQGDLIAGSNDYIISLLVSWLTGTGDSATVPLTDPDKPIAVTLTSPVIKAGQRIFQLIGDEVTDLGVAQSNGSITAYITEDPAIIVASTAPDAPTEVSAIASDSEATVSWSAPVADGGSEVLGYTVTASTGQTCTTTSTSCVLTGLVNGIATTFRVVATNVIGDSDPSSPSAAVTPNPESYLVTYNSNGGSMVADGSFFRGGTVSEPNAPSRDGYIFEGWSLILDDPASEVTFPYLPGADEPFTLFALWSEDPQAEEPEENNSTPQLSDPSEQEAPASELPIAYGQEKIWTKRISDTEVKVYIKFPEMGVHYRINVQKNGGEYKNRMRKTINTTSDTDLRVVGDWYYLVRTVRLSGEGRYRIEVTADGERVLLNDKRRPAVYTLER